MLMMLVLATRAYAETVVVDLLSYDINTSTNEATVTGPASAETEIHDLVIPDVVTVFGNEYKVTAVGESAFFRNNRLSGSLSIGNNVKEVGEHAFYKCQFDGELNLGNSIEIIGPNAFRNNNYKGKLVIPNSVKIIGNGSFRESGSFEGDLRIPDSVIEIGIRAFDFGFKEGRFDKLIIGRSVKKIGAYVLTYSVAERLECLCATPPEVASLTHEIIYVPKEYIDIYRSADGWKDNQILTGYDIPVTDITISKDIMNMCTGTNEHLEVQVTPDDACDLSVVWTSSDESIATVDDNGVVTAVSEGSAIISVRSSVAPYRNKECRVEVHKGALIGNLWYGIIDDEGSGNQSAKVFSGDPTIDTSINIADEVTIGGNTYQVTEIESGAFKDCSDFTGTLIIGKNIKKIGQSAFSGCDGLMGELIIPESVTTIGKSAFYGCRNFTGSLIIPNSITEIETYAFRNLEGMTGELIIPNTVRKIGIAAFNSGGFTGSLTIPQSVTEISERAFQNCRGFSGTLDIQGPIEVINQQTFHMCYGITRVNLPESLKRIEDNAFRLTGLKGSLVIPNSVTYIGYWIYGPNNNNNIDALLLGKNVETISSDPFSSYNKFKIVQTLSETPVSIVNGTFNVTESSVLYVPTGSLEAYKAAEGWNAFAEIRETDDIMTLEIEQDQNELELTTGESAVLATTIYPEMATNQEVTWSSSDESVATVNASGKVTAKNKGIAVITATAADGSGTMATCTVTVSPRKVTVDDMTYEVIPGEEGSMWTINVADGDCDEEGTLEIPTEVEIDGKIYTVNGIADEAFKDRSDITRLVISSTIKGIGSESFAGCTSLTEVVIEDGLAVLSFGKDTFRDAPIEKVYFGRGSNETASRPGKRSTAGRQAEESPFAGNLYLQHITIGEKVRYIADGMFDDCMSVETVEALGTVPPAISWLTFDEDTYYSAELRVQESAKSAYANAEYWQDFDHIYSFGQIPVASITLNLESAEMKTGEEQTLSATVTPENATKADVEWTSSDAAIATVNAEGKVKAVSAGKATITARTTDGSKLAASCEVTVTGASGVDDIESDGEGVTVSDGTIMAPEGSEIFDSTGRRTEGRNLNSGIYFVRTPKGKTVKVVI